MNELKFRRILISIMRTALEGDFSSAIDRLDELEMAMCSTNMPQPEKNMSQQVVTETRIEIYLAERTFRPELWEALKKFTEDKNIIDGRKVEVLTHVFRVLASGKFTLAE